MLDQAPIPTLLNMESALSAKNGAFSPTARSHCRASVHAKRTQSLPPRLAPVITPVRTNCLILLSPIIHILAVQMPLHHTLPLPSPFVCPGQRWRTPPTTA